MCVYIVYYSPLWMYSFKNIGEWEGGALHFFFFSAMGVPLGDQFKKPICPVRYSCHALYT